MHHHLRVDAEQLSFIKVEAIICLPTVPYLLD